MKRGSLVVAVLPLLLFFATASSAQTDNTPVPCGTYRVLHSKVLDEDRTLLIRLPEDYEKSGAKYPVLYKLDGYVDVFLQTSSAVTYLVDMARKTPDYIIVAIANTDRARDMSPEQGADNFIRFLKTELVPFIDKNYRTSGFDLLAGQSASAIFALYSFLKEPSLFDGYILSSFGLYRDSLATVFANELKRSQEIKTVGRKYIYVANGKTDSYDPDGSRTKKGDAFLDALRQAAPPAVQVKYKMYDEEGHVPFPTIYDALRWIYSQEGSTAK